MFIMPTGASGDREPDIGKLVTLALAVGFFTGQTTAETSQIIGTITIGILAVMILRRRG